MSPNRSDILKLAAGLGLTGAAPTSAERIAAAEVLNQRVSSSETLDPGTFAETTYSSLAGDLDNEWAGCICPEEHAAERRALREFHLVHPEFDHDISAFSEYQESVYALAIALYSAGLRHGAAYEGLRRSVVGERMTCDTCWGAGITRAGHDCPTCRGTGLVKHTA